MGRIRKRNNLMSYDLDYPISIYQFTILSVVLLRNLIYYEELGQENDSKLKKLVKAGLFGYFWIF